MQNRDICIQNISKETTYDNIDNRLSVDKNYGHISHAKLIKGNKIIIIHNLNKCDIYEINEHFDKIDEFVHIGDEVYSLDITYGYNILSRSFNKDYISNNKNHLNINYDDCGTNDKFKLTEQKTINVGSKKMKPSNSENKLDTLNLVRYNIHGKCK